MKRRLTSLLLVLAMILTLLPVQAFAAGTAKPVDTANPFEDVTQGSWYYDAVQYVRMNGLFNGTSKTTFWPEGTMTRGMFVTVLGRMAGVNPDNYTGSSTFTDVPENAYYAPYVAWASNYGIAVGSGSGKFLPNDYIDRQQMAVFFVRYFEIFGVGYETGANITAMPEDIDNVSPWAQDAVLKLWRAGLLVGNNGNFMPLDSATRAQAATICYRTDEAVDTWYSEPGIVSMRVKISPATGKPYTDQGQQPSNPSSGGGSSGGGSSSGGSSGGSSTPGGGNSGGTTTTTYYQVTFALGSGQASIDLPAAKTYAAGTRIDALPTPAQQDVLFLGWYYDAALTQPVGASDTVNRNMTLYAKTGNMDGLSAQETPTYITAADVETTFQLKLDRNINVSDLSIIQVSANNAEVKFTVDASGNVTLTGVVSEDGSITTINAWEAGHTYKAVLKDDSPAVFVHGGEPQPASIRVFNIIVKKEPVRNLTLNDTEGGLKYIPKTDIPTMSNSMQGLFTASLVQDSDGETKIETVDQTGTFTYSQGTLSVGDVVAVYEGKNPQERETAEDSEAAIVYVEITAVNGTTYTYRTAEAEDVLFIPDVLPVNSSKLTGSNTLTLTQSELDFSESEFSNSAAIDKGDFLAFYDGSLDNLDDDSNLTYGRITDVQENNGTYTITFANASESEVLASMDLYTEENKEIKLTDEQIQEIEQSILAQAEESGFVDEAARYLAALALETDGFQELAGDFDLQSYAIAFDDGTPVGEDDLSLMAESRAKITKKEIKPTIHAGKLDHFENNKGIRMDLNMELEITVDLGKDRSIVITLSAVFEQELMLSVNASGGAIWKKWKKIFPYIYDYRLNANLDMGCYVGIGITATAQTKGEDDEKFDWNMATGNSAGDKIVNIGEQIKDLMDEKDKFLNYDLVGGKGDDDDDDDGGVPISGGLEEKYAAMIEAADDSWIDIFRKQIFSVEGSVDPLHVLCYGVKVDFVVGANLYVTMGMTFTHEVAKRYNFSVLVKHKSCTNETIDLVTPQYEFTFYVMGTAGIRAGVEFELAVGLFSLKLDSVGVTAGTGAYAQLWGYFFYDLKGEKNPDTGKYDKTSQYSGAMLMEIGMYLKITFKAQLFSSSKLTYQPTLYENQWPLYSVGERENVLGFAEKDDDGKDIQTEYELAAVKTLTLPSSIFSMRYMDLRSGEIGGEMDEDETTKVKEMKPGRNCDDATESHFIITMSDSHYTYNPATNTVTINSEGAISLPDCVMTIRWKKGTLAFSSEPIERKITISWSNPNARYIAFDSQGGSPVKQIVGEPGAAVTAPAAPSKKGYDFGGWYTDSECTTAYTLPAALPESFGEEQGVTVYAKWNPRSDTPYTVEHYQQELNGTHTLTDTDKLTGATDSDITVALKTGGEWDHFTVKNMPAAQIAGNGATVVRVYYDREICTVAFTYGAPAGVGSIPVPKTYTAKYGATVYAPVLALSGYELTGYSGGAIPGTNVEVKGSATYEAQWTANSGTAYQVKHYQQNASGDGYDLADTENLTGTTGASVTAAAKTYEHFALNSSAAGAVPTGTIAGDGSLVLKLYYDRDTFAVTYNPNGGTLNENETTRTFRYEEAFSAPDVTRAGYGLAGWFDESSNTEYTSSNTITADVTVTAHWTEGAVNYTVEHYLQNLDAGYPEEASSLDTGSGITNDTIDLETLTKYSGEGFTFDHAGEASYTIAGDGTTVVKLYYTRNQHTLTWNLAGGTASGSYTSGTVYFGAPITPPTVTKEGSSFNGWDVTLPATMPDSDLTLTATWADPYKVRYHTDGGTLGSLSPVEEGSDVYEVQYGFADLEDNAYKLLQPTKEGYVFRGWYKNSYYMYDPVTEIRDQQSGTTQEFWAKWEELVSVTYQHLYLKDWEGGFTIEPVGEDILAEGQSLPSGLAPGETLPEPELKDRVFLYWSTDPESPVSHKVTAAPENGGTVYLVSVGKNINIASEPDMKFLDYNAFNTIYNSNPFKDTTFTLTNDIELSGWVSNSSFVGTLEGNGHTITYRGSGRPLFESVSGTVQNLKIAFEGDVYANFNYHNYWGVIAERCVSGGVVQNCHVGGGTVIVDIGTSTGLKVGGIVGEVGQAYGDSACTIANCTVGDSEDAPLYICLSTGGASFNCGGFVGCMGENSALSIGNGDKSYVALMMENTNSDPGYISRPHVGGIVGEFSGGRNNVVGGTIEFSGEGSELYVSIGVSENIGGSIGAVIGNRSGAYTEIATGSAAHTLTVHSNLGETENKYIASASPSVAGQLDGLTFEDGEEYSFTPPDAASVDGDLTNPIGGADGEKLPEDPENPGAGDDQNTPPAVDPAEEEPNLDPVDTDLEDGGDGDPEEEPNLGPVDADLEDDGDGDPEEEPNLGPVDADLEDDGDGDPEEEPKSEQQPDLTPAPEPDPAPAPETKPDPEPAPETKPDPEPDGGEDGGTSEEDV